MGFPASKQPGSPLKPLSPLRNLPEFAILSFFGKELAGINSPSRVRRERVLRLETLPCVPQGPFSFFTSTKRLSPKNSSTRMREPLKERRCDVSRPATCTLEKGVVFSTTVLVEPFPNIAPRTPIGENVS
jgi:hypothetical protein